MNLQQHKRQLMLLMILLLFVSQAGTDIYISGLPQMTREFHTQVATMNLSITLYVYAQAVFFLFMGVISDIFGRRKTLLVCILAQIIASQAIALTASLSLMLLLRMIQALGSGAIYIVLRLIIKDILPKVEQIHATGLLVIGLVLSPALAPAVGAWIIHYGTWRNCFTLIAVLQSLLWLWAFILIPETNLKIANFRANFSFSHHLGSYYKVLSDKFFITVVLIVGGTFASFYSFISISSYMYIDEYHISKILYAYTFIGVAGAYLLGNRLMLGLNKRRVSPWRILSYGIVLALGGILLMFVGLLCRNSALLLLGLTTCGIFLIRAATAYINPPLQVAVTHHFGAAGSHALGLLSCFQYVFAGLGSAVVAALPLLPSRSLFYSSLGFTLISVLGFYLCPKAELA